MLIEIICIKFISLLYETIVGIIKIIDKRFKLIKRKLVMRLSGEFVLKFNIFLFMWFLGLNYRLMKLLES